MKKLENGISEKIKVMIVEDSPLFRAYLMNFLSSKYKFEIEEIHSAQELQCYLTNVGIDNLHLIILDIYLPDGSGLEVIQSYKKKHPQADIPFIVISGYIDKETAAMAVKSGAKDVLIKPINFYELSERIDNIILSDKHKFSAPKSPIDYHRQVLLEVKRARRGAYPLSLFLMGIYSGKVFQLLHQKSGTWSSYELEKKLLKKMQGAMRETDTIVSLSFSEFLFILPFTAENGVTVVHEKVNQIVNKIIAEKEQGSFIVSASVTFQQDGDDHEKLISKLEANYERNISSQISEV